MPFTESIIEIAAPIAYAALRDALLPKLIFGEHRVKDAVRFVGGIGP